ncbi:MAG: SDR family oxidoreductase [bacterium]|nr:SDR family oxidoreductase [bacterium]
MDLGLQAARVIVTGGSRGIGAAASRIFAAEGARVAVVARTRSDVESIAAEIGGVPVAADLSTADGVAAAMDEAMAQLGGVDVLVNNAGSSTGGSILDADEQAWQETIDLKLMGYVRAMRAVLPAMQQQGSGTVVNVLGVAGTEASPGYVLACVVTALTHVSVSVGQLVAPDGVRVVAVHPGPTATDRLMEMVANAAAAQEMSPQEFADSVLGGRIPQGRVGRADEVARTIVFAASEASGFTNASQLYVDGGSAAKI